VELPDLIRFGGCELRLGSRELFLDGQVQVMEPRVFDLLVYLIRHRERVVPHAELFDQIWSGAAVTENVIAHTVMKARKAIGDTVVRTSALRTVHRVGYRFIGDIDAPSTAPPQGANDRAATAAGALRLGLMPFENATGEAALDWVEHGLASMVSSALDEDVRLTLMAPVEMASTLVQATGARQSAESPRALADMLGLQGVIRARLGRLRQGYALAYEGYGTEMTRVRGCIEGDEPMLLGQRMAHRIEVQLFPTAAVPVQFESSDTVARQNFARAMQAISELRWQSAAKLLQVVLDIEPDSVAAGIQQLKVFAALYDVAALQTGPQLLARAVRSGDTRQIANVHHALGHALLNLQGPTEESHRHIEEAMRLAQAFAPADWVVRIVMTHAQHELMNRRWSSARRLYARAAQSCRESGNRLYLTNVLNNHANIDSVSGNLTGALATLEDAMLLSEELKLKSTIAATGCNLALVNADLGLINRAVRIAERHIDSIGSIQSPRIAASVTLSICIVFALAWKPERMAEAITAWQSRGDDDLKGTAGFIEMALGHQAAAAGRLPEAAALMREGIEHIRRAGSLVRVEAWLPALLNVEVRRGDIDAIARVVVDIETLDVADAVDRQRGLVLHGRAVLSHLAGQPARALAGLQDAAELLPAGALNAFACFDAAWLSLESGAVDAARRLLRRLTPWLDEHPAGLLVRARLDAEQGDFDSALEVHRSFMRVGGWRVTDEHRRLETAYLTRSAPAASIALPSAA